ncbi:MAG: hypothetical protein K6U80_10665 [Firmicutes bacterium]|nr:hypothetical protein [Bacillota bacterium]
MPIVEIHMLPEQVKGLAELEEKIVKAFMDVKEIKNIKPNEIMVNIVPNYSLSNTGRFIYINILMYQREERTSIVMKKLCSSIGEAVFSFAKEKIPDFEMLEILPPKLIKATDCLVLTK